MKSQITCLFLLFAAPLLHGQTAPTLMSYQGRVTDAAGVLIGNTSPVNRDVIFKLYTLSSGGAPIYAEKQSVTISGGEFSVLIGNGAAVPGIVGPPTTLSTIINSNTYTNLYLGITVDDGTAAVDPEISPRQQMVSGAFALRAKVAESVAGGAVTTTMLGDAQVTNSKIAAGAVNGSRIANSSITANHITDSVITAGKLDTTSIGVWTPTGSSVYRAAGNVGIGETNPGIPLNFKSEIGNKISLFGNSGAHYGLGIQDALLQIYSSGSAADIAFGYGSSASFTENMRIKGNGNVGIGTSAPAERLDVAGTAQASRLYSNGVVRARGGNYGANSTNTGFSFDSNGDTAGGMFSSADGILQFYTNGTEKMRITGTGLVGLGTTNPREKLSIQDGKLWFTTASGNGDSGGIGGTMASNDFFRIFGYGDNDDGALYIDTYDGANEPIIFRQVAGVPGGATTAFERMRIHSNGYVGIGYSAPGVPLTVITTANYSVNTNSAVTSGGGTYLQEGNSDVMSADGYKGLNTNTAPISIYAAGGLIAQFVVFRSDERIKDIVSQTTSSEDLRLVNQLAIQNYKMKDRIANGESVYKGLIAQQVKEVMPEAVTRSTDYIPDIYSRAVGIEFDSENNQLTIDLDQSHKLVPGEWVRLHTEKGIIEGEIVTTPSDTTFVVAAQEAATEAFVYGRRVNDLLAVNYDRVFTTGIGAIQELSKKLDEKDATIATLEARLSALEKRMSDSK